VLIINWGTASTEDKRNELIAKDPKSTEILKPILRGRDIRRYGLDWKNLYIIFARQGVNIDNYPTIKQHLFKFRERLDPRPKDFTGKWKGRKLGPYKWYEIQDNIAYYEEFEKNKIVWPMVSSNSSMFCLAQEGVYLNNKCYLITGNSIKYILTVLNSKVAWWFFNAQEAKLGSKGLEIRKEGLSSFPLPKIPQNQTLIITLCDYMLFLNETEERRNSEKELIEFIDKQVIDSLVYELYFKEKIEEDGLKTNLLGLVESYLKDIDGLETDEEKLKLINEVVERIRGDKIAMSEMARIKGHEC
jgi:hypothetical protein